MAIPVRVKWGGGNGMLQHNPMNEGTTHHDLALADLVRERQTMFDDHLRGSRKLLSEEGHVFDHEPGIPDYNRDHPQFEDSEAHYYAEHEARYPVFLEHNFGSYEDNY